MAKSRKQLEAEGFQDFYRFGYGYLYRWIALIASLALLIFVLWNVLSSNYVILEKYLDYRCGINGCSVGNPLLFAFLIFLTFPIWLKLPASSILSIGGIAGAFLKLLWILDRKPDLAIGETGLYFLNWFNYQKVSWDEISSIEIVKLKKDNIEKIKIFGITSISQSAKSRNLPIVPLRCEIHPSLGFDLASVLASIQKHARNTPIKFVKNDE